MLNNQKIEESHPELAVEAFGWDPGLVSHGPGIPRAWECKFGHVFFSSPNARTSRGKIVPCPECAGLMLIPGKNDLKTTHPKIAAEAFGWDSWTVTAGVGESKDWKCYLGHIYRAKVAHRSAGSGCPYCANRKVLPGFNDLLTTHPQIAAQAFEWDPQTVTHGSGKRLKWRCSQGHIFITTPNARTNRYPKTMCPYSKFVEKHI